MTEHNGAFSIQEHLAFRELQTLFLSTCQVILSRQIPYCTDAQMTLGRVLEILEDKTQRGHQLLAEYRNDGNCWSNDHIHELISEIMESWLEPGQFHGYMSFALPPSLPLPRIIKQILFLRSIYFWSNPFEIDIILVKSEFPFIFLT